MIKTFIANGPAFPVRIDNFTDEPKEGIGTLPDGRPDVIPPDTFTQYAGMSLLDWFAGQALAGMLADTECDPSTKEAASVSYDFAAAMLAESVKRQALKP